MRRVRSELEQQHARILKQDPKWLFNEEEIRRNAKEGDMAFDNTDPVLLTIVSKTGTISENEQGGCAIMPYAEDRTRPSNSLGRRAAA